MKDLSVLLEKLRIFRDERDWQQFHTHKDLALSLVLEAGEVAQHFLWKTPREAEEHGRNHKDAVADELADVLKNLMFLADNLGIEDLVETAIKKLEKDGRKYPVEKARGRHTKYTEL